MVDLEILKKAPEGWTHVSLSSIDTPPTWLRYDVAGVYSVWMDDNGTNPNPYWREMPNNCIEFPEFIRSRNDIEQLAKANERVNELEKEIKSGIFEASCFDVDVIACLNKMAYEHNSNEIPRYREKAKRCVGRISNRTSDLNKFAIEKHDEGVDACIAELTRCYRVALDESHDIENANSIEVLIDHLQQLRKGGE